MQPFLTKTLPELLLNPDWKIQYTALETYGVLISALTTQISDMVDSIVCFILPYLDNANHHVRYMALDTIESFSLNYEPTFQEKYFDIMMVAYNKLLNIQLPVRLYAKVAVGIEILCADIDSMKNHVVDGLDFGLLIEKLFQMLSIKYIYIYISSVYIQEAGLGAISGLASIYDFSCYYERLMPSLITLLQSTSTEEGALPLKVRVIECIGYLVAAVPEDRFNADIVPILNILLNRNNSQPLLSTDPLISDIINTCVKIAMRMKSAFIKYFQFIYPAMITMSKQEIKYEIKEVNENEEEEEDIMEDEGKESFVFDKDGSTFKISFNSTAIEEKMQGCLFLKTFADIFEGDFFPYVEESFPIVLKMLFSGYYEGLREASARTLPTYLRCTLSHDKAVGDFNNSGVILEQGIRGLLKQLKVEEDVTNITTELDSLAEFVRISYQSGGLKSPARYNPALLVVPLDLSREIIEDMIARAKESIERRAQYYEDAKGDEDFDEEAQQDLEEQIEDEEALMINLIDSIGYLLKEHKLNLWDVFETVINPFLESLVRITEFSSFPLNALFLYEDSIEHMLPNAKKYVDITYKLIQTNIQIEKPNYVQASIYGLGVIALYHQDYLIGREKDICDLIVKYINGCKNGGEDYIYAYENAVSALCKLLMNSEVLKSNNNLWKLWLDNLPLVRDSEEAMIDHKLLMDLITQNHPIIVSNLPKVVQVLLKCTIDNIDPDGDIIVLVDPETRLKLKPTLLSLPNSAQLIQSVLSQFTPEEQNQIKNILSN